MKKVLITGANSMLGLNAVFAFSARGYHVSALVRHTNADLQRSGVEVVIGRVTDYDDVLSAAQGCDAIIHIAAVTSQKLLKLKQYTDINVATTEIVCRASLNSSAGRVVLVSTANTIGNGTPKALSNEATPPAPPFSKNLYAQSKLIAEQLALTSGADVVIVNPTFMIGAYDSKPSSGKVITICYGKKIAFAPKGGKNFVPARDVAQLLVTAMEKGKSGERYIASGVSLSFKDFYECLMPYQPRNVRVLVLPDFIMNSLGACGSLLRVFGVATDVSWCNMKILQQCEWYCSDRAVSELDMVHTPIEDAICECVTWMKQNQILK